MQPNCSNSANAEFERKIIQVADNVYSAHGYSVSVVGLIVGDSGLVVVDTGIDEASADELLADFRKINTLPINAILFTHSHPDHVGGLQRFLQEGVEQIWGRENFGTEMGDFLSVGLTIQGPRGMRQGGFKNYHQRSVSITVLLEPIILNGKILLLDRLAPSNELQKLS